MENLFSSGLLAFFPSSAKILLVVLSANGDGSVLIPRLVPILLNDILTDLFVQVIVLSIRTNRARCVLYKKTLDLLDEESVSRESSGRVSL